jgi:3-oxoadipate enol-lactonase
MAMIALGEDQFYYETHGEGQPALFISGLGGDHDDWHWQLPAHAAALRCIVFDNRMVGKSGAGWSRETHAPYTLELLASDAARLLDALGIERAHVIGASMGGAIALHFALTYPRKVISLSLHSTIARTSALFRLKLATQVELLKKLEVRELLLSLAPWIWSEETLVHRRAVIESFRALRTARGLGLTREAYLLQAAALMEFDVLARLKELAVPVLVTAGSEDALIPPGESRLIHDAVIGSEFHVFPGCGHASLMENADQFNDVSLGFLGRNGGRP